MTRTKATNRKMKAPMQSVGAGVMLERVGIDILGPYCQRLIKGTASSWW